jgi:hypothetical protein
VSAGVWGTDNTSFIMQGHILDEALLNATQKADFTLQEVFEAATRPLPTVITVLYVDAASGSLFGFKSVNYSGLAFKQAIPVERIIGAARPLADGGIAVQMTTDDDTDSWTGVLGVDGRLRMMFIEGYEIWGRTTSGSVDNTEAFTLLDNQGVGVLTFGKDDNADVIESARIFAQQLPLRANVKETGGGGNSASTTLAGDSSPDNAGHPRSAAAATAAVCVLALLIAL